MNMSNAIRFPCNFLAPFQLEKFKKELHKFFGKENF